MRETFRILSHARADSPSSSIAAVSIAVCEPSSAQNFAICAPVIAALTFAARFNPANLRFWISLAASTRARISADVSFFAAFARSLIGSAEASTCMSILSSMGPDTRALYACTCAGVQVHLLRGSPRYPHLQGFIAATSMNLHG